jgi:hypothetical protein
MLVVYAAGAMADRDLWYYKGLLGVFGLLGFPPFGPLAWYIARRDMNAPDFAQMPWHYRKRVKIAHRMGIIGSVLSVIWFFACCMMTAVNTVFPQ